MAEKQNKNEENWSQWAAEAQQGDKASYQKLLTALSSYIRNYLFQGLSNQDAAEDITQEVLISIHKSLKTYSPDRPFRPWLHAIINFRKTDYLRQYYSKKQDKQTSFDDLVFEKEFVTKPDHAGELKDVELTLESLPEHQSEIFKLIKIEGYTAQEVADKMNMNVSAVKVSAHRTMKKLQEKLKA